MLDHVVVVGTVQSSTNRITYRIQFGLELLVLSINKSLLVSGTDLTNIQGCMSF